MLIAQPEWRLSGVVCPCCRSGPLTFRTCPACSNVVLACDNAETVFASPRAVANGEAVKPLAEPFASAEVVCPTCGSLSLVEYRLATSEEVRSLGFAPGEYE